MTGIQKMLPTEGILGMLAKANDEPAVTEKIDIVAPSAAESQRVRALVRFVYALHVALCPAPTHVVSKERMKRDALLLSIVRDQVLLNRALQSIAGSLL